MERQDACQRSFLWDLDSEISAENMVRFIRMFADAIDVQGLGFDHTVRAATGRPPYAAQDLLALFVYGHLNHLRSSRRLETECRRNIELWWLLGCQAPDHNTIANFRRDNAKALKRAFAEFIRVCVELDLVGGREVCVDGTTLKASNSLKRSTSKELSAQKAAYFRKRIEAVEQYLAECEAEDEKEARRAALFELDLEPEKLPGLQHLKERLAFHEQEVRQMEQTGQSQILYTDPDAKVMKTKDGGRRACYNLQSAVDSDSHMVVALDVTNQPNDCNLLASTAQLAKENLAVESISAIADKGYDSGKDLLSCLENGIVPDVGFRIDKVQRVFVLDYLEAKITPELLSSRKPQDIQTCLHAGVLPDCYRNTNLSVRLETPGAVSCFIRHPDGSVTCPAGKPFFPRHVRKNGTVYASLKACRACTCRCTDGLSPKEVKFGPDTVYVPVQVYGTPEHPLQQIPAHIAQPDHYHAFGRVPKKPARVILTIRKDLDRQKKRMRISEHPFGTVKHYDGASWFLCRGKEKVTAEASLAFLSYNIRRAASLCGGVQKLIERFKGIPAPFFNLNTHFSAIPT